MTDNNAKLIALCLFHSVSSESNNCVHKQSLHQLGKQVM